MTTLSQQSLRLPLTGLLAAGLVFLSSCSKDTGIQPGEKNSAPQMKAALAVTDNFQFDFSTTVFISCANGGVGEDVTFTGTLHALTHLTLNGNSFTLKSHFQPQGVEGVGSISGARYQATGVTQSTQNGSLVNGSYSYTYVNNFKLIGQGPGNNFYDHDTFKVTINANGTVTVLRTAVNIDCK